jgi:S1-C subfamily serine protease
MRGYLGVGPASPTTSVTAAAGVPITSRVLVVQVSPGTPAAPAGLR